MAQSASAPADAEGAPFYTCVLPKDAGLAELEVKSLSIGQTRFSGLEIPGGATSRH
jgi:hypothetical protein